MIAEGVEVDRMVLQVVKRALNNADFAAICEELNLGVIGQVVSPTAMTQSKRLTRDTQQPLKEKRGTRL